MSIIQQPPTDGPPGVTTTKEAAKEPGPPSTDMVVTELIQARIKERSTLLPSTNLVEDIIIARDYLRQHQDRSVGQLTESVLVSMIGKNETVPQEVIDSVAERLRFGRTTGPTNDFENLLKIYCYYIEHICKKLKLPLHSGVAAGVVWHPSHVPAQKIIMTTNASMIVIPEWTLMLCHFICKLLSRAVSKKGASETIAVSYDSEQVLTKIRATPTLRKYAAGFFAYCATQNRMPLRSIKNATGLTRPVWVQLLMAVEIFVIGHEYGHHIALHSTVNPLESDPVILKVQELEADHIAALITAHIGAEFRLQFAHCGSAGVIALVGTDMVRRARSVLITGEEAPYLSETHPPLEDRLLMLETLRYDPRQADAVHRTRQHFRSIMEGLWDLILPDLKRMHARGIRPMPVARKDSQWLPFWG